MINLQNLSKNEIFLPNNPAPTPFVMNFLLLATFDFVDGPLWILTAAHKTQGCRKVFKKLSG